MNETEYWKTVLALAISTDPPAGDPDPDAALWYAARGLAGGVSALAVWDSGEQHVGVMRTPLREVLDAIEQARRELLTWPTT